MYIQTNTGLGAVTFPESVVPLSPPPRPLTEREVMLIAKSAGDLWGDQLGNIDVFAQKAIVRLSRNQLTSADAHALLDTVKSRELRGIFIENQKVPALRAQKLGTWYGKLIPAGEDAVIVPAPTGSPEPPLIAFRDSVKTNPARLDLALVKSWRAYQRSPRSLVVPCQPRTGGSLGRIPRQSVAAAINIVKPKLSFYQNYEDNPEHTAVFKALADKQAKRISAFGEPYLKSCESAVIGSTAYGFGADIINALEAVHRCLSKPVEEVHIFGHSGKHGIFGRAHDSKYGLYVNQVRKCPRTTTWSFEREHIMGGRVVDEIPTEALAIDVKILLHGCKTAVRIPKKYCFKDDCEGGRVTKCKCICRLSEGSGIAEELLQVLLRGGLSEAKVFGHAVFGDDVGVIGRNQDWWVFSRQNPDGRRATPGEVPYRQ